MFRISWWALWRRIRRLLRKRAMYGLPEIRKYSRRCDMSKKMVAYFSASGVTAKAAKELRQFAVRICTRLNRKLHTPVQI